MMSKFPGSDHSSRRRYVAKLLAERIDKNNNKNEIYICEAVCDARARVVGGHATIGRLSNNVFWTFQAIIKVYEKSR